MISTNPHQPQVDCVAVDTAAETVDTATGGWFAGPIDFY
eukprot:CAMPEP_0174989700 /NCGR_PEP_ID=MMETSP0004_2-20121128/20884_1 /TAXON_ID=420556 /ORGANISM="Ochromonas sp., Strain CCMP1393" /LENGTH=38 /DNA_ID= /DNA_START= /DNA_END= /DNA_ORIENTATION=